MKAQLPVLCLMGPTSSGKTQIALEIAKDLPCEIISVDSVMVYHQMDIGSAKPSPNELAQIPHHLIDIKDPSDPYSAAQFQLDASALIEQIHGQNKLPLLVGGTMLYFNALQNGLSSLPSADKEIRDRLLTEANKIGWGEMHARLQKIDPESAARIHPSDPQRVQRALEVYEITGKSLTDWFRLDQKKAIPYRFINMGISVDRELLAERIMLRFHQMIANGFILEVENLFNRGDLHSNLPAIRSVGYRQVWQYLNGEMNYQEMHERSVIATRQLAKRQLTWLRSWKDLIWFNGQNLNIIPNILHYLGELSLATN